MSSRQIRKLQKQKDLDKTQEILTRDSDGSEEDEPVVTKPRASLFAALGGDEDDDDEPKDEGDNDAATRPVTEEVTETPQPVTGKSKKKKKKKKEKKEKKGKVNTIATATTEPDAIEEDEDEIDKALKELNISNQTKAATSSSVSPSNMRTDAYLFRRNELLSINTYHLKAIHEMRNLFGREVIEHASAEEEQETRNRQAHRAIGQQVDLETFLRGDPRQPKLSEVSLRRNIFIQGREYWPRETAGGLTLKETKKAENGSWTEYAYIHEGDYDAIQCLFFGCVNVGDPMRMVHLLLRVPYHVSTLLQVSSIAKQDQNMALSAELCERALFTFGRVTTSLFRQNLEAGRARLDFRRPENRQFWLSGYHYLKSLIRKGTYRTGLEWTKLLYALDPTDPYAIRYFVHILAIRAHQAQWLINFVEEVDSLNKYADSKYLRQDLVLAKLQIGDLDGARADLEDGMKHVPWLYSALFRELSLDIPPSIWGINTADGPRSFWIKLYTYMTKDLWNNTQAIGLLQSVASGLEKINVESLTANDTAVDLGPVRLAYLEGQTALLALAPPQILERQPNYEFDPLPPLLEENIFTGRGTKLPFEYAGNNAQGTVPETEGENLFVQAVLRRLPAAQRRNAAAENAAAMVAAAAAADAEDAGDDRDALAELIDVDDLRQQFIAQGAGTGEGFIDAIRRIIRGGIGEPAADEHQPGDDADPEDSNVPERTEGIPGAWPSDEDESEHDGHH